MATGGQPDPNKPPSGRSAAVTTTNTAKGKKPAKKAPAKFAPKPKKK